MKAVVAVALALPIAGVVPAIAVPRPATARRVVAAFALADAVAWAVVAARGEVVRLSGFSVVPLAAAGAAGVALLLASARSAGTARSVLCGSAAVVAIDLGLAAGFDRGTGALAVMVAVGVILAAAADAQRDTLMIPLAALAAALLLVDGWTVAHHASGGWSIGTDGAVTQAAGVAVIFAGVVLVALGGASVRRTEAMLLVVGLLAIARVAPAVPHGALERGALVICIAAAIATAAAGYVAPAVGLLAAAAAAMSTAAVPASHVLGAAAVVVATSSDRRLWVTALPGSVALLATVAAIGGIASVATAAAAAIVAAILAFDPLRRADDVVPAADPAVWAAALLAGAWLVLAPTSWRWTGGVGLAAYQRGVALGLAAAALAVGAAVVAGFAPVPDWRSLLRSPGLGSVQPRSRTAHSDAASPAPISPD